MSSTFPAPGSSNSRRWLGTLLISFVVILVWSGYAPANRFIWILEATPAVIYATVLLALYPRVRLTMLVYCLIWLHAAVLLVGAHWTYSEVPFFDWLQEVGKIETDEMRRTFNCGVGMVVAVAAEDLDQALGMLADNGEVAWKLGEVVDGGEGVTFV